MNLKSMKYIILIILIVLLSSCSSPKGIRNDMAHDAIPVYNELKQMMVSGKVNADYKGSELFNAKYLKAENKTTQEYDLLMSINDLWGAILDDKLSSLTEAKSKVTSSQFVEVSQKIATLLNVK
jgi:uncharacterized lipoprotein YmbA